MSKAYLRKWARGVAIRSATAPIISAKRGYIVIRGSWYRYGDPIVWAHRIGYAVGKEARRLVVDYAREDRLRVE